MYCKGMNVDLRALKQNLKREFGYLPGINGFGIGVDHLLVYVRNDDSTKGLPQTFHGVRLEPIVTGDISAQSVNSKEIS